MIEYVLPHIRELSGYLPGEQPQEAGYIKLNTNENPYPPSPKVLEAICAELGRLRLYPDPEWADLRKAAAGIYGLPPERIFAGNGGDEILALVCRSFLGPGAGACCPVPTYTLYRTLAAIQNAPVTEIPFPPSWRLPVRELLASGATVAFISNPNSPTGTMVPQDEIRELASRFRGLVLVDEAYVDFANENSLPLLDEFANVALLRSLSKSYALAGLRVGLLFGRPELIDTLIKVKDSYNLDRLAAAGAAAALRDRQYFQELRTRILVSRQRLTDELKKRNFGALPSHSNFVCAAPPEPLNARTVYEKLKARRILVRYFPREMPCHLRITVGTDLEINALLEALDGFRS